jgi:hypothetical protein
MKRLHFTWLAQVLTPTLLLLAGCGDWAAGGGEVQPAGSRTRSGCVEWNDCDEDWRRRHWDDPSVSWCIPPNARSGSVPTADAGRGSAPRVDGGTGSTATTDAGLSSIATSEAGETSSAESDAASDRGSADAGADGGVVDAGTVADGGVADGGDADDRGQANSCTVGATCPAGTSCVMGSCSACSGGVCVCQRDEDCAASQICDHNAGRCTEPPPACTSLTSEADCSARADCAPIYGGMSCTNSAGSPCHSGEANCTCATYSFAACIAHSR